MESETSSNPRRLADGGENESSNSEENIEYRKFTVRFDDGTEKYRFEVQTPYVAALKAARKLIDPNGFTDPETAREENSVRLYLREISTRDLHVYDAWTWIRNEACPECEGVSVYTRKSKTPKYRCSNCGTEFEEPIEADEDDYLGDQIGAEVGGRGQSKVPKDEKLSS